MTQIYICGSVVSSAVGRLPVNSKIWWGNGYHLRWVIFAWAVFQSRQWKRKPVGCIIWMKTEPCLWVFRIWNYLQDIYSLQPYFVVDIHVASLTPPLLCHCLRCVGTLAGNNRLTRTLGVIRAYATIMSAHRGEVPCTVTTAKVWNPGKFLQLWGISKMIPGWLVL